MSSGRNRRSGNRRRRSPLVQSHRFAGAIEQSPARSRAAIFSSVWRAQSTRERPLRQVLVSAVSREQRGYRRRISREYEPRGPRVSAGSKSGTLFLKSFRDSPAIAQYTSIGSAPTDGCAAASGQAPAFRSKPNSANERPIAE